jgi:hypothetical protein
MKNGWKEDDITILILRVHEGIKLAKSRNLEGRS